MLYYHLGKAVISRFSALRVTKFGDYELITLSIYKAIAKSRDLSPFW
jgi:hypothetical protein